MKKVLLITDVNFWEKSSGHRTRISALVGYLAKHVKLTVVNTGPAPFEIENALVHRFNAEFFVLERTKYLNSNGYGRLLKAFLKNRHFDTIIIEYIHSSYFLNFLLEDAQVILDTHDIISERADEFKKFNYAGVLYELSKETESEILKVYDHVMVLCQPDADKVAAMTGAEKILLCPHPASPMEHPIRDEAKNIAFIASDYVPNRDAITWFISKCWPQISAKYNVQLSVYGTVSYEPDLKDQPQISNKGFTADIDQVYEDADIIINPVRFGAGLKIKNVEALAHGLPLVTTTHGARGIEKGINKAFLVADDAGSFIKSLALLIENVTVRRKLRQNALEFIRKNFPEEKCFKPLLDAINKPTA